MTQKTIETVNALFVAAFFFLTGMTCGTGQIRTDIRRILVPYYCFGLFSIAVFAVATLTVNAPVFIKFSVVL